MKTPRELIVELINKTRRFNVLEAFYHLQKHGHSPDQAVTEVQAFVDDLIKMKPG